MGTLTMALAAALLAGNAPERISGEMGLQLEGGRLDQKGSLWAGTIEYPPGWVWPAVYANGVMTVTKQDGPADHVRCSFTPLGRGRMEVRLEDRYPAIWKQEGNRIVVSLRVKGNTPPVDFKPSSSQQVITLRRVKPRK